MSDQVVDVEAGALYSHRRERTESATFVHAREYVTRRGAYQLDLGRDGRDRIALGIAVGHDVPGFSAQASSAPAHAAIAR